MLYNHTNAQILIKLSDRVVRGELCLACSFNPLTKASALDCTTVWPVEPSRKMASQRFTTVRNSSNLNILIAIQVARHVRTIFASVRSSVRSYDPPKFHWKERFNV